MIFISINLWDFSLSLVSIFSQQVLADDTVFYIPLSFCLKLYPHSLHSFHFISSTSYQTPRFLSFLISCFLLLWSFFSSLLSFSLFFLPGHDYSHIPYLPWIRWNRLSYSRNNRRGLFRCWYYDSIEWKGRRSTASSRTAVSMVQPVYQDCFLNIHT